MDKLITVYMRSRADRRVVDWATRAGATLDFPSAPGHVSLWNVEVGQIRVTIAELDRQIASSRPQLTFDTWYNDWSGMLVSIRHHDAPTHGFGMPAPRPFDDVTYDLEVVPHERRDEIVASLQASFLTEAEGLIGYVQAHNRQADYDWDTFMTDPSHEPWAPDLLVLSMEYADVTGWGVWDHDTPAPGYMTLRHLRSEDEDVPPDHDTPLSSSDAAPHHEGHGSDTHSTA